MMIFQNTWSNQSGVLLIDILKLIKLINEEYNITQEKNDTAFYDTFLTLTHISYGRFMFFRNRIIAHSDGAKVYSFKYLHCMKRVNIFSGPKKSKYRVASIT